MNSRQRRRLRRISERMWRQCDLTGMKNAQDLENFASNCSMPEYMLQEKGERPTEGDSIMVNVVEAIHKAAAGAGRVETRD